MHWLTTTYARYLSDACDKPSYGLSTPVEVTFLSGFYVYYS